MMVEKKMMRTNYIPALLVTIALAVPLWAGQNGRAGGGASHPGGASHYTGPHYGSGPRQQAQAPRPQQTFVQPERPQFEATRPPAMPHQIIRGQGPHNGDWLRNTMQLPPQEQQRRLEQDQHFRQLPEQRQEQLRNRLQTFSSMPPQRQQRVLNRMEMIEHLRPEQQRQAIVLFGQFRSMDPQRKEMMRGTLRQMRTMPPDAREQMLRSPDTQARYSPQEIQMLRGFNDIGFVGP
jgi:hypothetical protein